MNNYIAIFNKVDAIVLKALKIISVTMFFGLTLLLTANIVVRYAAVALQSSGIMVPSLHWFDEIIEFMYSGLVFYGAAGLWIYREHFCVGDWISPLIRNPRVKNFYKLIIELLSLVFILIFFIYSLKLTLESQDLTNAFQIRKSFLYMCMPISSAIMVLYSVKYLFLEIIGLINPTLVDPLLKKQHS
jgi:TRAP-type transport system small permease protein